MEPELARQTVAYTGTRSPARSSSISTSSISTSCSPTRAIRYGVGVGRQGFSWKGVASVGRKGVWPAWSPTRPWCASSRSCPTYREAGLDNPLGARALYLYQNGGDTLFRIHGTNEPWSIGEQVSSGCVRMLNEDVVDLYEPRSGRHDGVREAQRALPGVDRGIVGALKTGRASNGQFARSKVVPPKTDVLRPLCPSYSSAPRNLAVQVAFWPHMLQATTCVPQGDLARGSIDDAVGVRLR